MLKGDLYTEFNAESAKYRDVLDLLREHEEHFKWSTDETVMDAGCGPGDVTHNILLPWLPENSYKYVLGVDISPKMKDYGYEKYPHPKLHFETLDIASDSMDVVLGDPKFKDGFDKIFSFYVLNWILNLKKALINLRTLLKPHGQALVMFPANRHFQRAYREVQEKEPWAEILKGVNREISNYFYSDDPVGEFETLLQETELKAKICKCVQTEDEFESLDALKKLIESLDAHIMKIPPELKSNYLQECTEVMRKNKSLKQNEDGKVFVPHRRLIALIEK